MLAGITVGLHSGMPSFHHEEETQGVARHGSITVLRRAGLSLFFLFPQF